MTLWLDAQLPPALARWIGEQPWGVDAVPVREIGLRLGNSSNAALQQVLAATLEQALELLRSGEPWVEIRPQANAER
jgi:predicted nuclease of predicted toxin-antitoxin system